MRGGGGDGDIRVKLRKWRGVVGGQIAEQGNGLNAGCLEGAVGSSTFPSKTSERALKNYVCTDLCSV